MHSAADEITISGPMGHLVRLLYTDPARLPRVLLCDGPRGTAKTYGLLLFFVHFLQQYHGSHGLIARQRRKWMSATTLKTFEDVLDTCGLGVVHKGASPEHRTSYEFPMFGDASVTLAGFDDPNKIRSGEYDIVYINEANQVSSEAIHTVNSSKRKRRGGPSVPVRPTLMDCNPDHPKHWLRVWERDGRLVRWPARHEDNPAYYQNGKWTPDGLDYLSTLDTLTGAQYQRDRLGLWVAAEGAVFEEDWDEDRHVIARDEMPPLKTFFASVDWGFRNPFVVEVWGLYEDTVYRVREIYRVGQSSDWMMYQAKQLMEDFDIREFVCDSAESRIVEDWKLAGLPAMGADKTRLRKTDDVFGGPERGSIPSGIDLIRTRLRNNTFKVVRNTTGWYDTDGSWVCGVDPSLEREGSATGLVDEMTLYRYPNDDEGKPNQRDLPIKENDHAVDATRYAMRHLINRYGAAKRIARREKPVETYNVLDDVFATPQGALGL